MPETYTIRPYEPADREPFLDLYETVHGTTKEDRWFTWKYEDNPFAEDVAMIVAERDGDLVGARPLFALPMRYGDERFRTRQPSDAMVHPEHRRRGVFTRMIERAVARCETAGIDFLFTFPNTLSGGAYEKLGWVDVGSFPERYRPQKPLALLPTTRITSRTTNGLGAGLLDLASLPNRIGRHRSVGVRTEVRRDVPVDVLADLYSRAIPDGLHAPRDAHLLEWRFRNPDWVYRTFLGYHEGELTAAVVTAAGRWDGDTHLVRCMDILPASGGWRRDAALEVLIEDVIAAYEDMSLLMLPHGYLSNGIARRLGFIRSDRRPVSRLSTSTRLYVTDLSRSAQAAEVTSREQWAPSFVEYDTA